MSQKVWKETARSLGNVNEIQLVKCGLLPDLQSSMYVYVILQFVLYLTCFCIRRVWRYERGNQNPYIEEEQTTQWPQEKIQKDSGIHVPLFRFFCVVSCKSLFVLFLLVIIVVCPTLIYSFWLPLWFIKTFYLAHRSKWKDRQGKGHILCPWE
jgi:hypothetical protein